MVGWLVGYVKSREVKKKKRFCGARSEQKWSVTIGSAKQRLSSFLQITHFKAAMPRDE